MVLGERVVYPAQREIMTATREMRFFLADPERRVLRGLAARVPGWLRPNHFTALGTVGAVGTGLAYALTSFDARWLWIASLMLAVNWLGDSLDGTLARVRKSERPRYGYYLDHIVDAFSTIAIGIGLGLSPYVDLGVATGLVLVYLVLSINVYLESTVFGVFKLSYGRIGPTEVRLMLVLINTVLVLVAGVPSVPPASIALVANRVLLILLLTMVVLLGLRFARNLSNLAKLEPQELNGRSRGGRGAGSLPAPLEIVRRPVDVERAVPASRDALGRSTGETPLVAAHRRGVEAERLPHDQAG
jgi:phosphatidylglycerophosphate synthase